MAENGRLTVELPAVQLSRRRQEHRACRQDAGRRRISRSPRRKAPTSVDARVIGVIENQAPTKALQRPLNVKSGLVEWTATAMSARSPWSSATAARASVVNAFVSGFGYKVDCAVASTVAHDSHHMIVVGTNHADMAAAANRLSEVGGGVVVVSKGEEMALRRTAHRRPDVRRAAPRSSPPRPTSMVAAMEACGCTLNNAYHAAFAAGPCRSSRNCAFPTWGWSTSRRLRRSTCSSDNIAVVIAGFIPATQTQHNNCLNSRKNGSPQQVRG